MSYYIAVPLLLFAALIEASVLPLFRVFGVQPNLTLLILIAWTTVRGQQEVLYLIPFAGLFLGLVESAPIGTALIALAPIALFHELQGLRLREGRLVLTVAFTIFATILYDLVYVGVHAASGEAGSWGTAFLDVTMPSIVLNAVIIVPIYALVMLLSQDIRRSAFA